MKMVFRFVDRIKTATVATFIVSSIESLDQEINTPLSGLTGRAPAKNGHWVTRKL